MRQEHRARAVRGSARTMPAVITLPTVLALVLAAPAAGGAQQDAEPQPAGRASRRRPPGRHRAGCRRTTHVPRLGNRLRNAAAGAGGGHARHGDGHR